MFDGLKNLGNIAELMRNAGALKAKMQAMQEQLAQRQFSADAGGGMVSAVVNGRLEVVKVRIDKTRLDPNDTEMLEDLIVAAISAAQTKAAQGMKEAMSQMTADMGLPPGMLP